MTPREANADLLAEIAALRDRVASLTREVAALQDALAQGGQREAATGEILRVISSSPTDTQPVFMAMAASAAKLCEADDVTIFRVDGDVLRLVAHEGPIAPDTVLPLTEGTLGGRVIRQRRAIHVADMQAAETHEYPMSSEFARNRGFRTILSVPLVHDAQAIGVIAIRRTEVRPFTDRQVELVKTFAVQAVIAIENVRLFNETKEALDRQTATAEILRVISSSPTDIQPVFDAVAESAARLCAAFDAAIFLRDGDGLRLAAHHGPIPIQSTLPLVLGTSNGRAVLDGRTVHIADMQAQTDAFPEGSRNAQRLGHRTVLAVPLIREGVAIGTINVRRTVAQLFTDRQVALLQTFADQAVIAIENVRLFKELQEKNQALTQAHAQVSEALEQQTATSEILRVISQSPTDVQPVFDAIAESAARLCEAFNANIYRRNGDRLVLVAHHGAIVVGPVGHFSLSLARGTAGGRAVLDGRTIHIADMRTERDEFPESSENARRQGFRTILVVPLMREGAAIGVIAILRTEAQLFTDRQVALLQTFADQAVIAIENVRLFNELEVANRELAAASQHKSEFLANMSHELRTPLNAIIGFSEVLTERMFGELNEKQDEYLKDIYASGTHLLSLINDILDLSKIEAGRMELELTDFDLPMAIENALMLVRERAQRRSLTLHKDVDAEIGQVRADERKIRQVILNLLSNAIKFTPEGGRVDVRAGMVDGMAEISVTDTGVGIAPEDQGAIFEEFRQVGTADKKAEGTGLGLTLCRKFVELHGGRIWVKSQLDAGSTFTFTIPVCRGD
jgi:signal transduction histidine kinase